MLKQKSIARIINKKARITNKQQKARVLEYFVQKDIRKNRNNRVTKTPCGRMQDEFHVQLNMMLILKCITTPPTCAEDTGN